MKLKDAIRAKLSLSLALDFHHLTMSASITSPSTYFKNANPRQSRGNAGAHKDPGGEASSLSYALARTSIGPANDRTMAVDSSKQTWANGPNKPNSSDARCGSADQESGADRDHCEEDEVEATLSVGAQSSSTPKTKDNGHSGETLDISKDQASARPVKRRLRFDFFDLAERCSYCATRGKLCQARMRPDGTAFACTVCHKIKVTCSALRE